MVWLIGVGSSRSFGSAPAVRWWLVASLPLVAGNVSTKGYGDPGFGVPGNGEKFVEGSRATSKEPEE